MVGDYCNGRNFAARTGCGGNGYQRKPDVGQYLVGVETTAHVFVAGGVCAHHFGAIHNAATAHGHDEIAFVFASQSHSLDALADVGVGAHLIVYRNNADVGAAALNQTDDGGRVAPACKRRRGYQQTSPTFDVGDCAGNLLVQHTGAAPYPYGLYIFPHSCLKSKFQAKLHNPATPCKLFDTEMPQFRLQQVEKAGAVCAVHLCMMELE